MPAPAGRAKRWAVAESEWAGGAETYVLVANTGDVPTTVRATLMRAGATPLAADVAAGAGAVPLVVDWTLYADADGQRWAAGAGALGTCLP